MGRIHRARRTGFRFRVHGLRQRSGRSVSAVARPTDDGTLGRARPGRGQGHRGRSRAGVQGQLPHAASTHRNFHLIAAALARPTDPARPAWGDRPHDRRGRKGGRTDVKPSLAQRGVAELLGTTFLLAGVVGSGIMAARLAGGNGALALLCNTLPTGAILTVLILTFGPISGAHFNPAVSVALALRGELAGTTMGLYIGAQLIGGIIGVWAAHLMFELPLGQICETVRTGPGQWFAEAVATSGLLLTILGCGARTPTAVPYAVGLYITSAYWFTALPVFCQPRRDDCAIAVEYLRWYRTNRHHRLRLRAARRHASGGPSRT